MLVPHTFISFNKNFQQFLDLRSGSNLETLGLDKVGCLISSWYYRAKSGSQEKGTQIDMLLDRSDNAVTVCEMKYSNAKVALNRNLARNLADKLEIFSKNTKGDKQLFLTLITTHGLKKNIWSEDLVNQVITLNDLFY